MIVKSDRGYNEMIFIMFFSIIMLFVMLSVEESVFAGLVVCVLPSVIAVRFWIITGRTFIFSEKGCTVKFLFFENFYTWKDFKYVKLEVYNNSFEYKGWYKDGVCFSKSSKRRLKWLKPATYNFFESPFSFVFVYFRLENMTKYQSMHPGFYEVDKTEFLAKMKEWGIELE